MFYKRSIALWAALTLAGQVFAYGLGNAEVNSYLGQPFSAYVALQGFGSKPPDWQCEPIISRRTELPYPEGATVEFGDGVHLHVRSSRRIAEPVVGFQLALRCAGVRVSREYSVLLDPPGLATRLRVSAATAPVAVPVTPAPLRRPTPKLAGEAWVEPGDTLFELVDRNYHSTGAQRQQIADAIVAANPAAFVDADANQLIAGASLRLPDVPGRITAASPEIERAQITTPIEVPARLRITPVDLGKLALSLAMSDSLSNPRPVKAVTPPPAPVAIQPVEPVQPLAPVVSPREQQLQAELDVANSRLGAMSETIDALQQRLTALEARQGEATDVAALPLPEAPASESAAAASDPRTGWLVAALVMLILVAAVLWLLYRRRHDVVREDELNEREDEELQQSLAASLQFKEAPEYQASDSSLPLPSVAEVTSAGAVAALREAQTSTGSFKPFDGEKPQLSVVEGGAGQDASPAVSAPLQDTVIMEAPPPRVAAEETADSAEPPAALEEELQPVLDLEAAVLEDDLEVDPWSGFDQEFERQLAKVDEEMASKGGAGSARVKVADVEGKSVPGMLLEAELHLLYDQRDEALAILQGLVDHDDPARPDVRPWTSLFDFYRSGNEKPAFDALIERFRERYNIVVPNWVESADFGIDVGLEERYPWVAKNIVEQWNTPEVVLFLNALLVDDRDGKRAGFEPLAAEEISLLRDIALEP